MDLIDEREMLRLLRTHKASPADEAKLNRLLKMKERENAQHPRTPRQGAGRTATHGKGTGAVRHVKEDY